MTPGADQDSASLDELRRRLAEAEETLTAIRTGEADAVVVEGAAGQQVYCLESPDEPFRVFVERMQEGALTLSAEGTVIYCNPFFAELLQRPLDQVRGRSLASFVAPDHEAAFHALLDKAVDAVVYGDAHLVDGEGRNVPVQLTFNRLPAEHIRMFGVVVSDLTERERAKRLEIERQTAEEARAARDQFLAVMSHELRAPLSAILGWAQVLRQRDDLPDLVQHGLDVIVRNAWAQSHLIEDLLDVSRILAGKLRLDLSPIDLGAVIRAAVASVQPSAEAKQLVVDTVLPQAVRVRGDADRLQQVVFNLLSNAVKFSREGGTVRIELQDRGDVAEISVADSGVGISKQDLSKIFDLFTQTGVDHRSSGGLGLGLAIVRQLTELHHGEVSAASAGPGRGATFTVRLPVLRHSGEVEEPSPGEEPATAGANLRGVRLIIVEDHQDEREMLVQMLRQAGAEVLAASTAGEALQLLEGERVDLLISDIKLPDADGYELIRRIRASGLSGKDLPAIALTAFAGREDRRQALMAGYQMHVSKPLDQDELQAMVGNLVGSGDGANATTW